MNLLLSYYLCFIFFLIYTERRYIDQLGIFHANQLLFILIHIKNKGAVGAVKQVWALQ